MLRYAVLGSGSKANAYIFQGKGISFLVDNGYSLKELTRRTAEAGFTLSNLDFVFLTHTHNDHFRGIETLCRRLDVPVVAPAAMPLNNLWRRENPPRRLDVEAGREYRHGALSFEAFPISHDSPAAAGYAFSLGERRFAVMTDTGRIMGDMERLAPQCDLLFVEANYDPDLLAQSSYPAFVKHRIASDQGHLSNQDTAVFLQKITSQSGNRLERLYLTHLSEENNTPQAVERTLQEELTWPGPLTICQRNKLYVPKEEHYAVR